MLPVVSFQFRTEITQTLSRMKSRDERGEVFVCKGGERMSEISTQGECVLQAVPVEFDNRASDVVAGLMKVSHRLRTTLTSHFSEFGLSDVRFSVMQIIRDSAPEGCSQACIAEELDQSESSISTLVERMRSSRLLYRLRSDQDRRKRVLMLTEIGRNLLEKTERCHDERMAAMLSCFRGDQLGQFSQLLALLQEQLSSSEERDIRMENRRSLEMDQDTFTPQEAKPAA